MGLEKIKGQLEKARALQIEADTLTDEILYDLTEGGIDLNDETEIDYCESLEEAINSYVLMGRYKLEDVMKEIAKQINTDKYR